MDEARREPRFQTVTGVCDFCMGQMDNCPYCRGRGCVYDVIDSETGCAVESGVCRPTEGDAIPYRAPDWYCPACGAKRPWRHTNGTKVWKDDSWALSGKDGVGLWPGQRRWECCGFVEGASNE